MTQTKENEMLGCVYATKSISNKVLHYKATYFTLNWIDISCGM